MELRYDDVRKFGTLEIRTSDELYTTNPLVKIGQDFIKKYDDLKNK